MSYLWETHMHTAETSRCAQVGAAEMVAAYKKAGYHGVVITDHFLNGNNVARHNAPWQRRVDVMMRGYNAARITGEWLGIHVLFGYEFTYHGADYLTYGIEEAFLRDQPDLADLPIDDYVQRVHAAGGFISQAHPFRAAWYMPNNVEKRWDIIDAVEVFNGSHLASERQWDEDALAMALAHDLIQTAGSDAHTLMDVGTAGVSFEESFCTSDALLAAFRARKGKIIRNRA